MPRLQSPPQAPAAIEARGLRVAYDAGWVLHSLDLRFAAGRVSVVLGPGGSGKSTLLHVLGGRPAGRPDPWWEGELRRPGVRPRWLAQRWTADRAAAASLADWLAVEAPGEAPAKVLARTWEAAPDAVRALEPLLRRPLEGLPLALGRLAELTAVTCRGSLLLLDEPEVHLEDVHREWLVRRLRALRDRATVVVATHHLGLARAVADHVLLLCAGRVEEAGDAPAVFESPRHARTRHFFEMGS